MNQLMASIRVARLPIMLLGSLGLAVLFCPLAVGGSSPDRIESKSISEKEVSFKTEDGWTIYGTLSTPAGLVQDQRIPAVVLIPSPTHDSDIYGHNGYPSLRAALETEGIATIRIDIRGRGRSDQPREFHSLTDEQRARVALDVGGAIQFLSQQNNIDANRIGVVAEGASAGPAVVAGFKDRRVCAMALLSGRMPQPAKDQIATRDDLPILCVVSSEDKIGFADMSDAYKFSRSPASNLMVHRDLGIGNSMFITWAAKFPKERPLESTVAGWLTAQLQPATGSREVSFQTEDGWTIFGSLRVPHAHEPQGAPGVVLVHSNLSDRHVYDDLERMLADAGLAVLNIDFRGRGKSRGQGSYFALPPEERDKAFLDVRAGLEFLASQAGVDGGRLAVVATAVGTRYGLKAANSSDRVKAFVMLGGLPDRKEVEKSQFPILFVSTLGVPPIAQAFRDFYKLTKDRGSYLIEHEGGALGYQIFEIDETLQPLIVNWLKPRLAVSPKEG
jgi:dienelactone hydrolase